MYPLLARCPNLFTVATIGKIQCMNNLGANRTEGRLFLDFKLIAQRCFVGSCFDHSFSIYGVDSVIWLTVIWY